MRIKDKFMNDSFTKKILNIFSAETLDDLSYAEFRYLVKCFKEKEKNYENKYVCN